MAAGTNTTFNVSASDATSYKWQISTNGGGLFADISNGGVYSGATTATLTIAGATIGMNGYQYRAVASGSTSPDAISSAATLTVNKAAQTLSFTSSAPTTAVVGDTYTPTATAISGLVAMISVDSTSAAICSISGGVVSFNGVGVCVINANQAGDAGWNAAVQVQQTVTIGKATPALSVSASDSDPTVGTSVTFTATISGGTSPTGTVEFFDGSTSLGTGTLSGTTATFSTSALVVGSHSVTAVYAGDSNNAVASSSAITVTVAAPTITVSPTTLPSPMVGASYGAATLSANGGTAPYSFTVTGGALPAGMSLSSGGVLSGTPTAGGTFPTITVTATDDNGYTGTRDYTLSVTAPTISISPMSLPDGTVGSAYSTQTMSVTGGTAPYTFEFSGILPDGMTFDTATGEIAGTPTTQSYYAFTVKVTDSSTGSGPYSAQTTVSINIVTPTVVLSPADGTTLTAGQVGVPYNDTSISATGGSGTILYYADDDADLPPGLSIDEATGAISGMPTSAGSYSFTVWAAGAMGGAALAEYAVVIAAPAATVPGAPTIGTATAGHGEATVTFTAPASDGGDPITEYTVTSSPGGKTATGVASPLTVTGLDNGTPYTFTVMAKNGVGPGAASAASNSVTPVAAATVPGAPTIGTATAGNGEATVTFTAPASDGGDPITEYTVTSSPGGKTATGVASPLIVTGLDNGTPYTFTVTAKNGVGPGAASAASNSVTPVAAATVPGAPTIGTATVGNGEATVTFTAPASDGGDPITEYTVTSSPGGKTATGVASPLIVTGLDNGTPYTFTVTAKNGVGPGAASAASNSVTPAAPAGPSVDLIISPTTGTRLPDAMPLEKYEQSITATGGNGIVTYRLASGTLPSGMILNHTTGKLLGDEVLDTGTEGTYSFTIEAEDADHTVVSATYSLSVVPRAVTVEDQVKSVAPGATPLPVDLTLGATGGPFLAAATTFVEPANAGTATITNGEYAALAPPTSVGWYLKFTPAPGFTGTAKVGFTLTSSLGVSNNGIITFNLGYDANQVVDETHDLVQGFVQSRLGMIASTIDVPNLIERRAMAAASTPITTSLMPYADSVTATASTSLAAMMAAEVGEGGVVEVPFNAWLDATVLLHNRAQNGDRWGSFAMVSAGFDYLLNDKALIGLAFHFDRMSDPTGADDTLTGNGWLLGPYASFELGDGVFWDSSLSYGGSANDIDRNSWYGSFDTTRWLIDTKISGQWQLGDATVLTPRLRMVYLSETVNGYAITNAAGDVLSIQGFTTEQLRISLGGAIAHRFALDDGRLLTLSLDADAGLAPLNGTGLFGSISPGLNLSLPGGPTISTKASINVDNTGSTSVGGRIGITGQF